LFAENSLFHRIVLVEWRRKLAPGVCPVKSFPPCGLSAMNDGDNLAPLYKSRARATESRVMVMNEISITAQALQHPVAVAAYYYSDFMF
jgi:hypothetical protein